MQSNTKKQKGLKSENNGQGKSLKNYLVTGAFIGVILAIINTSVLGALGIIFYPIYFLFEGLFAYLFKDPEEAMLALLIIVGDIMLVVSSLALSFYFYKRKSFSKETLKKVELTVLAVILLLALLSEFF